MQPTIQYSIYMNILKPTVQLQIYSTQPTIQYIHEYSQAYTVQLQIQYTVHSQAYSIYMNILKPTVQLQIYCTLYTVQYTANHTEYT